MQVSMLRATNVIGQSPTLPCRKEMNLPPMMSEGLGPDRNKHVHMTSAQIFKDRPSVPLRHVLEPFAIAGQSWVRDLRLADDRRITDALHGE